MYPPTAPLLLMVPQDICFYSSLCQFCYCYNFLAGILITVNLNTINLHLLANKDDQWFGGEIEITNLIKIHIFLSKNFCHGTMCSAEMDGKSCLKKGSWDGLNSPLLLTGR